MDKETTALEKEARGLAVFVGIFTHSLDPKKRITIPSVWRSQVGTPRTLFILPDFHKKCLNVFPAAEMSLKLDKIRRQSMTDSKAMDFASTLGAASDLVSWDTQGRIRIKDHLLNFSGIDEQVVMVGAFDKFQLWSPANRSDLGEIDQARLVQAGQYINF